MKVIRRLRRVAALLGCACVFMLVLGMFIVIQGYRSHQQWRATVHAAGGKTGGVEHCFVVRNAKRFIMPGWFWNSIPRSFRKSIEIVGHPDFEPAQGHTFLIALLSRCTNVNAPSDADGLWLEEIPNSITSINLSSCQKLTATDIDRLISGNEINSISIAFNQFTEDEIQRWKRKGVEIKVTN